MIHEFEDMPLVVTPLGDGYALLVECDRHDYYWTVVLDNGALVTFPQDKIRMARSYTFGRGISDDEMRRIVEPREERERRRNEK